MAHSLHLLFSAVAVDACLPYIAADDCVVLMCELDRAQLSALQLRLRDIRQLHAMRSPVPDSAPTRIDYAALVGMTSAAARVISWP